MCSGRLFQATSGADSIWHGGHVPPTFPNVWVWGHREYKNSKQETDETVLTITKAFVKRRTFIDKKVEGHDQKFFRHFAPDGCPSPHFQIRSSATAARQFVLCRVEPSGMYDGVVFLRKVKVAPVCLCAAECSSGLSTTSKLALETDL